MAITFDQARAIVATSEGWDPAPWGWENNDVFVMAYADAEPHTSEPYLLVDKHTGGLIWVDSQAANPPAANLRPIR